MRYRHVLLVFTFLVFTIFVFNTQAFTTFSSDRDVSLQTADDRYGLISLDPYGENGIYFTDEANDGTYEFNISDIPLQDVYYDNVMTITNNLNNPVTVKIEDTGDYDHKVHFYSDSYNLESEGRSISVGNSIYVDLNINATGLEDVSLLDSINIIAYQDDQDIYNMDRSVLLTTVEGSIYDPYANDMPTNAQYLAEMAREVLNEVGTITEGSGCFEDMGLDPDIWDANINGYEYGYYEDYDGVIYIKNIQERIYMGWYGWNITVNKNTGILYSVYNDYYYAKVGRWWFSDAYLVSYY